MHTSLGLGGRNALYAVDPRLILQGAVDVVALYGEVYLLVSSHGTGVGIGYRQFPTLLLAVPLIHIKKVACEERSLVATGSGAYLHLHVLGVLGVLRH